MEASQHLNIIFIGHVDSGKSTIGGNIMYLTGRVDERTIQKYKKLAKEQNRESWYLSWALDTTDEEREKGKTVECGRAFFNTENKDITIIDAPGHRGYIPHMINGIGDADIAILVISARKGEFEAGFHKEGQTREHVLLAKAFGISKLIVVINKMDDMTVNWSEERYNECKNSLTKYLKKIGYNIKKNVYWAPISGLKGHNIKDKLDPKICSWWRGDSLLTYLDKYNFKKVGTDKPLRIPITNKYSKMGVIISGKIQSGSIYKGQNICLMPNRKKIDIDTISYADKIVDNAKVGDNVSIKIKNITEKEIYNGCVLCDMDNLCSVGKIFDAQIMVMNCPNIICSGFIAILHLHSVVITVEIVKLIRMINKKTGKVIPKITPIFIKNGQMCIVRLKTTEPICIETFKDNSHMGRFTLRNNDESIAFGKVLKVIS